MARTLDEFSLNVRGILQDRGSTKRYTDTDIAEGLNASLERVRSLRPDAYTGKLRDPVPTYSATDDWTTEVFPLADIFFTPCVYYVVGYCELRDDEFTVNARAATLMNEFTSSITGRRSA